MTGSLLAVTPRSNLDPNGPPKIIPVITSIEVAGRLIVSALRYLKAILKGVPALSLLEVSAIR